MTQPARAGAPDSDTRPSPPEAAAALPLNARDGLTPVGVPVAHSATLVRGDLRAVVRRVAVPAVARSPSS
jgi:hypothetical protein